MYARVRFYSNIDGEIYKFLTRFYENKEDTKIKNNNFNSMYLHSLEWENIYSNPIEIATIIGVYIDNSDNFNIKMWISLDINIFINITDSNANDIIKYLYERYPY